MCTPEKLLHICWDFVNSYNKASLKLFSCFLVAHDASTVNITMENCVNSVFSSFMWKRYIIWRNCDVIRKKSICFSFIFFYLIVCISKHYVPIKNSCQLSSFLGPKPWLNDNQYLQAWWKKVYKTLVALDMINSSLQWGTLVNYSPLMIPHEAVDQVQHSQHLLSITYIFRITVCW